jgi:hypothetical protein
VTVDKKSENKKKKYGRQYETREQNNVTTKEKESDKEEKDDDGPTFQIWKPALPIITSKKNGTQQRKQNIKVICPKPIILGVNHTDDSDHKGSPGMTCPKPIMLGVSQANHSDPSGIITINPIKNEKEEMGNNPEIEIMEENDSMNNAEDPSNDPEYKIPEEPAEDTMKRNKNLLTVKIIRNEMTSNNENTTEVHEDEKGELKQPQISMTMSHNTMDTSTKVRGDFQDTKVNTESVIMNFQEHLRGVKYKNDALLFENT